MPNLHLGKGLGALISDKKAQVQDQPLREIEVSKIVPNQRQPRKEFDDEKLNELAASIKEKGLIQPIVVRVIPGGSYEIIAGERRLRAAKLLGLSKIPAVVRGKVTDEDALQLALIENLQRDDLNPIEEAQAYHHLSEEFGLTQDQIALKVGKQRSTVANTLRLLALPREIQDYLLKNQISMGHARALLALQNRKEQMDLCLQILSESISVRETEQRVTALLQGEAKIKKVRRLKRDPHLVDLEEKLQKILSAQVVVRHRGKIGRIEIYYYSLDEFDRLAEKLGIKKE